MKKQKLITHLFSSYILLVLAAILLMIIFSSNAIENFYFEQKVLDLRVRARLVDEVLKQSQIMDNTNLQKLCEQIGLETKTRFTLIDTLGLVLADSDEDPANMDLHHDRPEIMDALAGPEGVSRRVSYTLEEEHLYYAQRSSSGVQNMIVRVSLPTLPLKSALYSLKVNLALIGLVIILLIAILNWYLSGLIIKPIQVMEAGARRFARGKLKLKVPESNISELGSLARSLNRMAEQIFDRIRTVTQQKNEQIAILSSMVEGVLALDPEGRLISFNRAAASLFDLKMHQSQGRMLHEVIRHIELIDFSTRILKSKKSLECRISIYEPNERTLNVIGSRMPSKKGAAGGAVIVLTDLTRIQQLERVRQEFVANVSHELKTPITSIQGYVETLQDGALNKPEDAQRFINIIAKHSNRLGQIVDDLLELSRIEEISFKHDEKYLESVLVSDLFENTIQNFQVLACQKNITIRKDVDQTLYINVNAKLMSLAIGNLLDNGLKYSGQGREVCLRCVREKKHVILEVIDQGQGIEMEHLSRIFERFYRVDKGRSRDEGGTGLGLSLVKHIARIHGGKIEVDSIPDKGSTFRIIIPA